MSTTAFELHLRFLHSAELQVIVLSIDPLLATPDRARISGRPERLGYFHKPVATGLPSRTVITMASRAVLEASNKRSLKMNNNDEQFEQRIADFLQQVEDFLKDKDPTRKRSGEPLDGLPRAVRSVFPYTIGRGFGRHKSAEDEIKELISQTRNKSHRERLREILMLL